MSTAAIVKLLTETLHAEMDGPYGDDAMPTVSDESIKAAAKQIAALLSQREADAVERCALIAEHTISADFSGLRIPRFRDGTLVAEAIRSSSKETTPT